MSRKFALIIGNSQYQDPRLAQLITPQEDVNDLAEVLRAPAIGGFDEVKTLVNETDANIRLNLEDFFAEKKPDDLLVVYFSGHGVRDEQGLLYLAVNNTRANRLRATAIPAEFITSEMDRSRSKRQVLILDCCHSGAFAQGSKAVTGESAGTGPAFEGLGYGRVVLTATDATQYAWEGDKTIGQAENSVFTRYLIEGLRTGSADTNHDGTITLDEMYDYVYEKVVAATPKQTPGKWAYKQQGDIIIARTIASIELVPLPIELQRLLDNELPTARLKAMDELVHLLQSDNLGLGLSARAALQKLTEDDSLRVRAAAVQILATDPLASVNDTQGLASPLTVPAIETQSSSAAPAKPVETSVLKNRLSWIPRWVWMSGGAILIAVLAFGVGMLRQGNNIVPTPLPTPTLKSTVVGSGAAIAAATPTLTPRPDPTSTPTPAPTWTLLPPSPSATSFAGEPSVDRFEPNDIFAAATNIGLSVKYDNLNLVPWKYDPNTWDKDFFAVRVKTQMKVTCRTLDLRPGTDTYLTLYDAGQKPIDSSDDVNKLGGDLSSSVTYTAKYDGILYALVEQRFSTPQSATAYYGYSFECTISAQ